MPITKLEKLDSPPRRKDNDPDSKVHGAHIGPTWVLSAPGGSHVGPMNFAIREAVFCEFNIWSITFCHHRCNVCDIAFFVSEWDQHDDVTKWKHFPRYWPFVRGIHQSPVNSPHKGQLHGALMFSWICTSIKRLNKQSWGSWFGTPSCLLWRHRNGPKVSWYAILKGTTQFYFWYGCDFWWW